MSDSASIYNDLMGIEKQIGSYNQYLPNAKRDISNAINTAVDFNKAALTDTADMQKYAYSAPHEITQEYNNLPINQRPMALNTLGTAIGGFGARLGLRDLFSNIAKQKQAGIDNIIGDAVQSYMLPLQQLQDAYGRKFGLYNTAVNREESAASRAAAARAASGYGSSGGENSIAALLANLRAEQTPSPAVSNAAKAIAAGAQAFMPNKSTPLDAARAAVLSARPKLNFSF